ncbi:hypothetical protein AB0J38_33135 [Streptomyces sp. NPDC050095]|uniref:hypothetical protein n=1 Tax=unclassified Streptomyces TaxID=2593676 RepID=UPI003443C2F1
MTDRQPDPEVRPETPGKHPPVVPRDLPDQQAGAREEDPLEVRWQRQPNPEEEEPEPDDSVPDPDEAGAGRRGRPLAGGFRTDQPAPDEPSG